MPDLEQVPATKMNIDEKSLLITTSPGVIITTGETSVTRDFTR